MSEARLVIVRAVCRKRDGLWIAWSEGTDPLVVATGDTEQEALDGVHDELELALGARGEYLGTVHG